ncbi:uncharacterized protein si:dkey-171c9.3 [Centropristis striata]|uniref:uncharacterized protein si:dkey-171c9.3 n=1 Tax=Centropristis striata TaxID=184440 RepID=UPI0027E10E5F|nr:uncharacterized protein si:dkey-171c9.3 [Centropristis striata]
MQTASADPEPTLESLERRQPNIWVLEEFAQNMAENITQSFLSQMEMVEPEVDCRFNENQEMLAEELAEELASAVVEDALREVCGGQSVEDQPKGSRAAWVKKDGLMGIQTSKHTKPCPFPLSQSGFPIVGSLDYPDAPPTTPLLPELERSRHSFARKLKGGLATVFLPSPPPPTPKDKDNDLDEATNDPQVELMEHLMHSLSTHDSARDYFAVGANMEAFAEALSCDIIDWVLSDRKQTADDSDLHLLAHKLAETIITSSLVEAKMLD